MSNITTKKRKRDVKIKKEKIKVKIKKENVEEEKANNRDEELNNNNATKSTDNEDTTFKNKRRKLIKKEKVKGSDVKLKDTTNTSSSSSNNNNSSLIKKEISVPPKIKKKVINKKNVIKKEKVKSVSEIELDELKSNKPTINNETNFTKECDKYISYLDKIVEKINTNDDRANTSAMKFLNMGFDFLSLKIEGIMRRRKATDENMKLLWNTYHSINQKFKDTLLNVRAYKNEAKHIYQISKNIRRDVCELRNIHWRQTRALRTRLATNLQYNTNHLAPDKLLGRRLDEDDDDEAQDKTSSSTNENLVSDLMSKLIMDFHSINHAISNQLDPIEADILKMKRKVLTIRTVKPIHKENIKSENKTIICNFYIKIPKNNVQEENKLIVSFKICSDDSVQIKLLQIDRDDKFYIVYQCFVSLLINALGLKSVMDPKLRLSSEKVKNCDFIWTNRVRQNINDRFIEIQKNPPQLNFLIKLVYPILSKLK